MFDDITSVKLRRTSVKDDVMKTCDSLVKSVTNQTNSIGVALTATSLLRSGAVVMLLGM